MSITSFLPFRLAHVALMFALIILSSEAALAQSTAFTYQGRLNDNGLPANGTYDFQLKLFDALTAGNQVGATNSLTTVAVNNGSFSVTLDFGAAAFPGANRWLEIHVRIGGSGPFTTLNPRQPITSTPYAIRSLNATAADSLSATCTGCITSSQIGSLPTNSTGYIQNATTQQVNANFNISGNGTLGGTLTANSVGVGMAVPATPLDIVGALSVRGATAPPVAPAGQGRLYFDAALNKFRISQNGGAYSDLFGSGSGVTGNGTTGTVPLWSGNTILGNSAITQSSSDLFIDLPVSPVSVFGMRNTAGRAAIVARSTVGSGELFLDRGSALSSNASQVGFYTAGNPDFSLGTSQGSAGNSDFSIYNYGTGSNALTIPKSSSNVGIGTTAPAARLHIVGSSSFDPLKLQTTNISGTRSFRLGPGVGISSTFGIYDDQAQAIRLMIDYFSGYVGIGTTSTPQARLHIANATGSGAGLFVEASEGDRAAVNYSAHVGVVIDSFRPSDQRRLPVLLQPNGGNVGIGTPSPQAKLHVAGTVLTRVLQINNGADLSEQFEVNVPLNATSHIGLEKIQPGMVVSIDANNPGKLVVSHRAYDRKVAGIISGAGGVQSGMLMGQPGSIADGDQPVALTGRVYCWADTANGPIQPGDLLTTSNSTGHAMKVTDYKKAQGAILGKAMTGLKRGRGLVLVLVTLQ